ncbi:serine hydrolase domain-containing protein [Sphingosinicella rhizophila]|uniref:Serine hydrolase domain-containing protein n=1 Tax=Sphingosinicella rhizophila TaxID=3050082 RepID=A0ABU3Q328_9SPHN|nr:serine hydrolase domain-containing protein [Sphingosinicella sp. GR2756]MDT9597370.1 serine hydrolase domain-containing protein [Sphingosinicella sp. GR2756]
MTRSGLFAGIAMLAACLLGLLGEAARAQTALSPEAVAAWADAHVGAAMLAGKTDAAVITVVQDGRVLLAKGYGWSDAGRTKPIGPESRIRIASISKLFVATAVAQLLERRLIRSIDDPANDYLKRFKLPANTNIPISIRHLLTHTAGFEDIMFGTATNRPVAVPLSAKDIRPRLPDFARPPGGLIDYSNAGYSILALLIEDVTGLSYAQYLDSRILRPLGMNATALDLSVDKPKNLVESRVLLAGGRSRPVPWTALHPFSAPAGSVISTAVDMARFMAAASLRSGDASSPLLRASGQENMFRPIAWSHPAMTGIGIGYFTQRWNGRLIAEHGGDLPGAHTMLVMIPSLRAGIFISMSNEAQPASPGARRNRDHSPRQMGYRFLAHFLGPLRLDTNIAGARQATGDLAGDYVFQRRPHKGIRMLDPVISVRTKDKDHLEIVGIAALKPLAPGIYEGTDKGIFNYVAFTAGRSGDPVMVPYFPFSSLKRVTGLDHPGTVGTLGLAGLALFITGLLALRWPNATRLERWATRSPAMILTAGIVASILFVAPIWGGLSGFEAYAYGDRRGAVFLVVMVNALLACVLAAILMAIRGWQAGLWGSGRPGTARRVHFSLLAVALCLVLLPLRYMNLIGWPF